MLVPFSGGCGCGAIRYEFSAEPAMSLNCHCRDCQRGSGTAYASLLSGFSSKFLHIFIVSMQFRAGVGLGKLPLHGLLGVIALRGPGADFMA